MMYSRERAAQLAERVRSLVGPIDHASSRDLAAELGVSAGDLREIVVHATPYPSVSLLAALVAAYGVDAGWLLTGDYSPAVHRAAEERGESAKVRLARILREAPTDNR